MSTTCRTCGKDALPETLGKTGGECMACARMAKDQALCQALRRERVGGSTSLFSAPTLLRANKNASYRASVLALAQTFAETLDELNLAAVSLSTRFAASNENFHIVDLDLNASGEAFAKIAFRTWLAKTDRWKQENKTVPKMKESLVAEYKKFQAARGAA